MRSYIILIICLSGLLVLSLGGCKAATSQSKSPMTALIETLLSDSSGQIEKLQEQLLSSDADLRREGVLKLGQKKMARKKATPKILRNMAQADPDPQVRAAAVSVLARIDKGQILLTVLQTAARDVSPLVRRECVVPLGIQNDEQAGAILLEMLRTDEEAELRAEAAAALKNYPAPKTIRGLIEGLTDEAFSVNYQCRQSLIKLTGKDFGYDHTAWKKVESRE